MDKKQRIGLALGGGSARGWAHIGVIRELEKLGIKPDVICGSSIGALVGGAYASHALDPLENWLRTLDWQETLSYFDFSFRGGLIEGKKLFNFFLQHLTDHEISKLPVTYAAVATNLDTGAETWLNKGSLLDTVRASIALPGLFTPVFRDNAWLIDGALVNPVPVSLCRALGADTVIAVDLAATLIGKRLKKTSNTDEEEPAFMKKVRELWRPNTNSDDSPRPPSLFDTMSNALTIVQVEITRSRLAIEPADVLITPELAEIGLLEFYRANEAIDAGAEATKKMSAELKKLTE